MYLLTSEMQDGQRGDFSLFCTLAIFIPDILLKEIINYICDSEGRKDLKEHNFLLSPHLLRYSLKGKRTEQKISGNWNILDKFQSKGRF